MGDFFGYSCVPGVKDKEHDPKGNNPRNLCEACIGDENDRHICVNNPRERHYGEAGALRYSVGFCFFFRVAGSIRDDGERYFKGTCYSTTRHGLDEYNLLSAL